MGSSHSIRLAGTSSVGPKGQVVIPADVREAMNIKPGDKLIALYSPDKKVVAFITEAGAQSMVDSLGEKLSGLRSIINNKE